MLSPIIRKKIETRFKQPIRYARQCEALAAHITEVTRSEISASTIKRLMGFIKGEFIPRQWTLDTIAVYIKYDSWDDLQNELAGNKDHKKKRIETVDCTCVMPGKVIEIKFGKIARVRLEALGKQLFNVHDQVRTELRPNDQVEIEKIQIDLPILVKVNRDGTSTSGIILGGITGVTEILELDRAQLPSKTSK